MFMRSLRDDSGNVGGHMRCFCIKINCLLKRIRVTLSHKIAKIIRVMQVAS